MNEKLAVKPPKWFWIVSVLALLWNLMGVGAYLQQVFMFAEDLELLTQEERQLMEVQPAWVHGAFAIAVWAGALGCIALLLRKKWARAVLIISLLGILGQMTYMFFMSDTFAVSGSSAMIMPIMIIVVGFLLVFLARSATDKKWLV
ncbi:MAG: hypothetical protein MUO53_11665 [Maribacter sp.]|nr:hypothetical protein [Maribacter sp.]